MVSDLAHAVGVAETAVNEVVHWVEEARHQCNRAIAAEKRMAEAEALLRRAANIMWATSIDPETRSAIDAFLAAGGDPDA